MRASGRLAATFSRRLTVSTVGALEGAAAASKELERTQAYLVKAIPRAVGQKEEVIARSASSRSKKSASWSQFQEATDRPRIS